MFLHYAIGEIIPICTCSTFFEDLGFLNPRIHLKGSDCRIHFRYMSKVDAINIMTNSDLKKSIIINSFLLYIKK